MVILCNGCSQKVSDSFSKSSAVDNLARDLKGKAFVQVLCPECSSASKDKVQADSSRLAALEMAVRRLEALLAGFSQSAPGTSQSGQRSYSAALTGSLPNIIQKAADSAVRKAETAASDEANRKRKVVIDGLPESSDANADRSNVCALVSKLGVPSAPCSVRRVGVAKKAAPGEPRKPRKVVVQLAAQEHQRHLTSPTIRRCLRSPEWEGHHPGLFINPALTKEERTRLWLLRRRRNDLNRASDRARAEGVPYKHWMLDSRRGILVCRVNGVVDRNIRDQPVAKWASDYISRGPDSAASGRGGGEEVEPGGGGG